MNIVIWVRTSVCLPASLTCQSQVWLWVGRTQNIRGPSRTLEAYSHHSFLQMHLLPTPKSKNWLAIKIQPRLQQWQNLHGITIVCYWGVIATYQSLHWTQRQGSRFRLWRVQLEHLHFILIQRLVQHSRWLTSYRLSRKVCKHVFVWSTPCVLFWSNMTSKLPYQSSQVGTLLFSFELVNILPLSRWLSQYIH